MLDCWPETSLCLTLWMRGQLGLTSGPNNSYHPGPDWPLTSMVSEFLRRSRELLPTPLFKAGENMQNATKVHRGSGQLPTAVSSQCSGPLATPIVSLQSSAHYLKGRDPAVRES